MRNECGAGVRRPGTSAATECGDLGRVRRQSAEAWDEGRRSAECGARNDCGRASQPQRSEPRSIDSALLPVPRSRSPHPATHRTDRRSRSPHAATALVIVRSSRSQRVETPSLRNERDYIARKPIWLVQIHEVPCVVVDDELASSERACESLLWLNADRSIAAAGHDEDRHREAFSSREPVREEPVAHQRRAELSGVTQATRHFDAILTLSQHRIGEHDRVAEGLVIRPGR